MHVTAVRLLDEGVALVEAIAEVKPTTTVEGEPCSTLVLTKHDGRWLIASERETIYRAPVASPALEGPRVAGGRLGQ